MLEMAVEISKNKADIHKWATFEKNQVFPVKPVINFIFIKLFVSILILVTGFSLHFLIYIGSKLGKRN